MWYLVQDEGLQDQLCLCNYLLIEINYNVARIFYLARMRNENILILREVIGAFSTFILKNQERTKCS